MMLERSKPSQGAAWLDVERIRAVDQPSAIMGVHNARALVRVLGDVPRIGARGHVGVPAARVA